MHRKSIALAHPVALLAFLAAPLAARAAGPHDHLDPFPDGARTLHAVMEHLGKSYVDKLSDEDLYRAAVAGVLSAGGRSWDQLLSPSDLRALKSDLAGEVVGIGIELKLDDDTHSYVVSRVIDGGPAQRSAVAAGDQILQIDEQPVAGRALAEVIASIRGPAGSTVALGVLHAGQLTTRALRREKLSLAPVGERDLGDGVTLVTLRSFNEKTPALFAQALTAAASRHARALVLDLRDSPGGLFEGMVTCAGMLLPRGSVVVELESRDGAAERITTTRDPILAGVPVVVVANAHTASGAEILAGALRDVLGARVVGTKTFGKWNVQRIDELENGWAIKFTTGRFRTGKGEALDGKGLIPDLEVDSANDGPLRAATALLKLSH